MCIVIVKASTIQFDLDQIILIYQFIRLRAKMCTRYNRAVFANRGEEC